MATKRIPRYKVYGGYSEDAEFFKMDHREFTNYIGGLLAVNLFRGNFESMVSAAVNYAYARGIKYARENRR